MSPSPPRSTVTGSGDAAAVGLPAALAAAWREGIELCWTSLPPDAALLLRAGARVDGVLLASVQTLPVDELFGLLVSGVRTGKLVYARAAVRKTVSLKDGQVVFATSSEPWERLGHTLLKLGLVEKDTLAAALAEVRPGVKLGQVLHRRKLVTQAQLYGAMTYLAREIVVELFGEAHGSLLFLEGAPPPEDVLKLPEATRDLVLKGIGRAEEVRRLRRRLPQGMRVVRDAAAAPPEDPGQRALWDRLAAAATLAELRAAFEGSEHAFLSALDALLSAGRLAKQPRAPEQPVAAGPAGAGRPVLEQYDALVQTICGALGAAGQGLADLRSFLDDPLPGMERPLQGVTLSDEGRLDVARVAANAGADSPEGRARTYEVLHAFVSYALFSARNVLPAEVAEGLQRAFRKLQEGSPE